MMSSKYTAFRCPDDLLVKAKKKAILQNRSVSNYIITLIAKDIQNTSGIRVTKNRKK